MKTNIVKEEQLNTRKNQTNTTSERENIEDAKVYLLLDEENSKSIKRENGNKEKDARKNSNESKK